MSSVWGSFLSAPLLRGVLVLHVGERPGGSRVRPEPEVSPVVELSRLEGRGTTLCSPQSSPFNLSDSELITFHITYFIFNSVTSAVVS